jgi:hypothetical protein
MFGPDAVASSFVTHCLHDASFPLGILHLLLLESPGVVTRLTRQLWRPVPRVPLLLGDSMHGSPIIRSYQFTDTSPNHCDSGRTIFARLSCCVKSSRRLLRWLKARHDQGRHDIIVAKSEVCPYLGHESIWLSGGYNAQERECHVIQSQKIMFTLASNECGFVAKAKMQCELLFE